MMASPRLIHLLICFLTVLTLLTLISLFHTQPEGPIATESVPTIHKDGIRAFFSFRPPSTLFPSSAIISLTDDNSTFFLARPADFGPSLPAKGLSGQLWVGSGFGDVNLRGGSSADAEGELGCSDVPGWGEGHNRHYGDARALVDHMEHQASKEDSDYGKQGRSKLQEQFPPQREKQATTWNDGGTDDNRHSPPFGGVSASTPSSKNRRHQPTEPQYSTSHADIQSLQESAEISGKIVLLSRGGCGFLEKVKWTQRRGGTALIVGDDTRGGALITMYARGDTSNVTIPSLFTSHTTAHLLSSLIPSGRGPKGSELGVTFSSSQSQGDPKNSPIESEGSERSRANQDRPVFTFAESLPKPTMATQPLPLRSKTHIKAFSEKDDISKKTHNASWLRSLLSKLGVGEQSRVADLSEGSMRPPSSGRLDWLSEEWADMQQNEQDSTYQTRQKLQGTLTVSKISNRPSDQASNDDFVIGVQDWRDQNLLLPKSRLEKADMTTTNTASQPRSTTVESVIDTLENAKNPANHLAGGIITPGSGEYEMLDYSKKSVKSSEHNYLHETALEPGDSHKKEELNIMQRQMLFGKDPDQDAQDKSSEPKSTIHRGETPHVLANKEALNTLREHDGLWVTLTPTTMSTSPFFDTLFVLVVSPLITLTVVYALLLLRSRIRRRRWRAPKSVVNQLPVRTYHTMTCSSTASSSQFATPKTSSPASPLLESNPQQISPHPRPRSRTTSGMVEAVSASLDTATKELSRKEQEKATREFASKKKYAGKQVECVVCLEEYVDGHSRVMSLPCGHEFHAECM